MINHYFQEFPELNFSLNRQLPHKAFLQRNERFGVYNFDNGLNFLNDNLFEMLVAPGKNLNQKRVFAGDVVTFDDFGNLFYFLKNLFVRAC